MKVFLVGATGFIGRSVAERLLADGHTLVALARSEEAASALAAAGIEPRLVNGGWLGDLEAIAAAVSGCDAAIDTAVHNFREALPGIRAIRSALGTNGILISTTGTNFYGDVPSSSEQEPVTEDQGFGWKPRMPELWADELQFMMERMALWWPKFEAAVLEGSEGAAARTCIIRPGLVHGRGSGGLGGGIIRQMQAAVKQSWVPFVNDGRTGCRGSVHVDDLADLYALALRSLDSGALATGSILNACSGTFSQRGLADAVSVICGNLPVKELTLAEAGKLLGIFTAEEMTMICVPDTLKARKLGWTPKHPCILEDIVSGSYADAAAELISGAAVRSKL